MLDALARTVARGRRALHAGEYHAPFWQHWASFSIPHRPTPKEIGIYRSFIGSPVVPNANVLMFGATPELRDLAAELDTKPLLIDMSRHMLEGMLSYAKRADAAREIWRRDNWLTAVLPEGFFDIVLGDLFLRHVAPELQRGLLAKIAASCRLDAKVVMRVHVRNPAYARLPWNEIFDGVMDLPYATEENDVMGILHSRLLDRSVENGRASRARILDAARSYLAVCRAPFSYRVFLYEFLDKRASRVSDLAVPERDDLERLLADRFSIIDTACDETYQESAHYPVVLLSRKGLNGPARVHDQRS